MRFLVLVATLALLVAGEVLAVSPAGVEARIRQLEYRVRGQGRVSFTYKYEKYVYKKGSGTYVRFDRSGVKLEEFAFKPGGILRYESWYAAGIPKERLLEDDRTISFNSFHKNGVKWEEYHYNKQKKLKAYFVYDKNGKQVE